MLAGPVSRHLPVFIFTGVQQRGNHCCLTTLYLLPPDLLVTHCPLWWSCQTEMTNGNYSHCGQSPAVGNHSGNAAPVPENNCLQVKISYPAHCLRLAAQVPSGKLKSLTEIFKDRPSCGHAWNNWSSSPVVCAYHSNMWKNFSFLLFLNDCIGKDENKLVLSDGGGMVRV